MKFDYKKIASAASSVALIASTVAFAAAANYPAPFVENGAANVAVVYGSGASLDLPAVTNIQTSLSNALADQGGSSGSTGIGGDFVQLDKSSDKLNLGDAMNGPFGSTVDDEDLTEVLADGTYTADDNDEFDYEQKITLGSTKLTHFRDSDYENLVGLSERTPTIGFKLSSNTLALNYTLEFIDEPETDVVSGDLEDIEGSDIPLFGRTWYVSDAKNGTDTVGSGGVFGKFTLLDSGVKSIVAEGEQAVVTAGGKTYEVAISFVDSSEVVLDVNGELTNSLNEGETYKLSDGSYVGIRDILTQDYQGGIKKVDFSIGNGKLELSSGSNVKINDVDVQGVKAWVHRGTADGSTQKIDKIVVEWITDDEEFITPETDLEMPGFGGVKFTMNDFVRPEEEMITIENDGDTSIQITVPIKDGDASFNLLFSDATTGNFSGVGKAADERLAGSGDNNLQFIDKLGGSDYHEWFVATYNTTNDAESYLLKASVTETTSRNETTITNAVTGQTVCDGKTVNDKCDFGDISLTINEIYKSGNDEWVNFTAGSNVNFNTIFTKGGLKIYLPYNLTNEGVTETTKGAINLSGLAITAGHGVQDYYLFWDEEDKDDNKASGFLGVNLTIDDNSDKELQVSQIELAGSGGGNGLEVGDSSNTFEAYSISDIATRWLHYTNGDQDYVEIYYPAGNDGDSESYTELFLSSSDTTFTSSSNLGDVIFTDSEIDSASTRNLIVVGGSCVNSVAADLLGSTNPVCGSAFESLTGVGPGSFLTQTFGDVYSTGKVATLVAGYEAGDTANAATFLTTEEVMTDDDKKYVGETGSSATLVSG